MVQRYHQLYKIWEVVNFIPGWLRILVLSKDYDQEEILTLEQIDEEAVAYEKEAEKCFEVYKRTVFPEELKKFTEEIREECGEEFIRSSGLEFLNQQIKGLSDKIEKIWKEEEEAQKKDHPYWFRKALLEIKKPELLEKKRRGLVVERFLVENPQKKTWGRVSGEEIAMALRYPFEQLIQLNKAGFALCPFHKENMPSFYVKNNWGYCFGCGRNFDTIHFLMERDGLTFPQAVRALQ